MAETLRFTLNDQPVRLKVDGSRRLIWVLRTELGLTGTKLGCERGFCGACTVLVNDEPVRSCVTSVGRVNGKRVVTIEGFAKDGKLHPLQKAFIENDALQCGYCTPGMILTAYGLLRKQRRLTREEIARGMDRNLCRCGAHKRILEAIESAADEMR
jgi:aerobic-type carbon monoxide dehydrogenase small subunit (CoxS/CutS family)